MINNLCAEAHITSKEHGFWEPGYITIKEERTLLLAKMALIVSEVGEAVEEIRKEGFANLEEELADICIRVFDLSGYLEYDLQESILQKMEKNKTRPFKHGKEA